MLSVLVQLSELKRSLLGVVLGPRGEGLRCENLARLKLSTRREFNIKGG